MEYHQFNYQLYILSQSHVITQSHSVGMHDITIFTWLQVKVRQVNKGDSKPDDVMNANFTAILQVSSFNPAAGKGVDSETLRFRISLCIRIRFWMDS